MSTLAVEINPLAEEVKFDNDNLIVCLVDGRTIKAPIVWFPKLANATEKEKNKWELLGDGEGIHWPEIDEDLSVSGLLRGIH